MAGLSRKDCQRLRQSSHSVVYPTFAGVESPVPIVLLHDGTISRQSLEFFLEPNQRNKPLATKKKIVRAIGLFYDFYFSNFRSDLSRPTDNILGEFADTLLHGTIDVHGEDPGSLYINPLGESEYYLCLKTVAEFSLFCRDFYHGDSPFEIESKFLRLMDDSLRLEQRKFNSRYAFLGHLDHRKISSHNTSLSRTIIKRDRLLGFGQSGRTEYQFPTKYIIPLIQEGTRRNRARSQLYWDLYQVREQLIFLLMFFCGLRESEIVHLYVGDVRYDYKKQRVNIILGHPSEGIVIHNGKRITRREYLRNEFELLPRTMVTGHKHAGWKNLQLLDSKNKQTFGFWLCKEASDMFWELHKIYLAKLRPGSLDHPYYFVNLSGQEYGAPLSIKKIQRQWEACCSRIGLQVSKDFGTSPHGARSFYAQVLESSGAAPQIIQSALHQRSPLSQLDYLRKSFGKIQTFLDEGAERIARGLTSQDINLEQLNIHSRVDPLGLFN